MPTTRRAASCSAAILPKTGDAARWLPRRAIICALLYIWGYALPDYAHAEVVTTSMPRHFAVRLAELMPGPVPHYFEALGGTSRRAKQHFSAYTHFAAAATLAGFILPRSARPPRHSRCLKRLSGRGCQASFLIEARLYHFGGEMKRARRRAVLRDYRSISPPPSSYAATAAAAYEVYLRFTHADSHDALAWLMLPRRRCRILPLATRRG